MSYRLKLAVVNENTLGYIRPENPDTLIILRALITKGARFSVYDDPLPLCMSIDKIRLATAKDFEDYRVLFTDKGFGNKNEYEYAK